jgi:oligoendopeptidase F
MDSFSTVFVQEKFFLFESDVHQHRKEKGELGINDLNGYYDHRMSQLYGDSVLRMEDSGYGWMFVPHFFYTPFYVYSYAFGELLSQSLYAKYKQEGKAFVDNYIEALKAGGSKSPAEITAMMGVDITDPKFWDDGLDLLEKYVDEFEELTATV